MKCFRRVVAGTAIQDWWDNGVNAIAFSRGSKGFVAINRENATLTTTITTSLAPGTYCDVLTGGRNGGQCVGSAITVSTAGTVQLNLGAMSAVVVHEGVRL